MIEKNTCCSDSVYISLLCAYIDSQTICFALYILLQSFFSPYGWLISQLAVKKGKSYSQNFQI
jgi:hypothetical protein